MAEAGIAPSRQLPTQHHGAAFEGSRPFPPQVFGLTASRAFDICTHEGLGKKRRGPAVGQHPAAQGKARASGCCRQRFANFLFFFCCVSSSRRHPQPPRVYDLRCCVFAALRGILLGEAGALAASCVWVKALRSSRVEAAVSGKRM